VLGVCVWLRFGCRGHGENYGLVGITARVNLGCANSVDRALPFVPNSNLACSESRRPGFTHAVISHSTVSARFDSCLPESGK
jgi:hypothetical protein